MKKYILLLAATLLSVSLSHLDIPARNAADNADSWTMVSDHTTATVYNAVASQCNKSPLVTASRFQLQPDRINDYRIIAMERTMMAEFGLSYGDVVRVEGAGDYDGLWQIQDTMNKRFAGQHKIDFLVPENVRTGKWTNVRVYVPDNDFTKDNAKKQFLI